VAATVSLLACSSCRDEKPRPDPNAAPPPPSASVTGASAVGACTTGGGELTDPVSAPFFSKTVGGYCIDPHGEIRTFGEKGKLSMDEVCTTAFDGECEVYKRFQLKRVVSLHYVDGSGKGGSVEVNLSQFADVAGAYGMFTLRVVAGDPADTTIQQPRPLAAGGAGAIGTGRAYVWRGTHLAELQYVNENESPEQLTKSSETILTAVAKDLGQRLPGATSLPPAAQLLPAEARVPNGILFQPKDVLAWKGVGPGAIGFYKDGDRRWRVVAIVKDDAEQAKDAFKTIKATAGSLPIPNTGDEAAHVAFSPSGEGGGGAAPKVEMLVSRKGNVVFGMSDEEYALRGAAPAAVDKARLTKDEATTKMKALLSAPIPAPAGSGSAAKPAPSASAPGKKP
jgi:hypothetical protein